MVQLADQLGDCVAHQPGIGIQRHHILDAVGNRVRARQEARILVAAQKQVELVQLAALALPAHPHAFAGIEQPPPVEKEEARATIEGIFARETGNLPLRIFEDLDILGGFLGLAVLPVADQRETDFAARICQIVHFEVPDQLVDRIPVGEHARHGEERPRILGDAILELVADKPGRFHEIGDERIE